MITAKSLSQEYKISGRSERFDNLVITAFSYASEGYFRVLLNGVEEMDPKTNEAILDILIEQLASSEPNRWEEMALYGLTLIAMVSSLMLFQSLDVSIVTRYLSSTIIAVGTLFIGIKFLKHHQLQRVQNIIEFLIPSNEGGCDK